MFPVGRPIRFGEAAETSGSHRPRSRWSALDVHSETEASIVWKRTPHKADDLVAKGAQEALSPALAAGGAEATLTSLANDAAVLAVITGPDGVAVADPRRSCRCRLRAGHVPDRGLAGALRPAAAGYWTLATDLIRDFFGKLPLVAPGLRNRLDDVVSGDREGWFSTTLRAKDIRLADQLARSHGLRLPVGETVLTLYEQGRPKDGPTPTSRRSSS